MSSPIPEAGVEGQVWIAPDSVDGCSLLPASASGKIVVLARGGCAFQQKGENTAASGSLAMVVTNNVGDTIADGLAVPF